MSSYPNHLRQFASLYPPIDATATSSRDALRDTLFNAASKLLEQYNQVAVLTKAFIETKSQADLQQLCDELFNALPIETDGVYHPMLPTQEQLAAFLDGNMRNIGDCKLLTVLTAYICNILARIPCLLSVRPYNGHPILYIQLPSGVYKISFRYNGAIVKLYNGESPFGLTAENAYNPAFTDTDFRDGEEESTLYWDVLNAICVLDVLNILRRCVVNFSLDLDLYLREFDQAIKYLKSTGIYADPVVNYWASEMDRISDLWRDPRSGKDPQLFRRNVIDSLRFTE